MELKDSLASAPYSPQIVSIAPLWNWKKSTVRIRTWLWLFQSHLYGIERSSRVWSSPTMNVSIAPLWNWKCYIAKDNNHFAQFQSHLYGIESFMILHSFTYSFVSIAPLWNWKCHRPLLSLSPLCFNRTFMELKVIPKYAASTANAMFQSHLYGIESPVERGVAYV